MAVVLIIDDSPTELNLFQGMLERGGYETLVADSGDEGIRIAQTERPDCILMDVVMITTKDQETDKIWGMRQGAVEYIVKPVDEKDLIAKIGSVMAD